MSCAGVVRPSFQHWNLPDVDATVGTAQTDDLCTRRRLGQMVDLTVWNEILVAGVLREEGKFQLSRVSVGCVIHTRSWPLLERPGAYKVQISRLVLVVLDIPEVPQDDLIGAGQVPYGSRGQGGQLVLGGWAVCKVEARARVGRDGPGVRVMMATRLCSVGQHWCVRERRCEGGWGRLGRLRVVDRVGAREATHVE